MKYTVKILSLYIFTVSVIFCGCNERKEHLASGQNTNIPASDINVRKRIENINRLLNEAAIENDYEIQLKYFSENAIIDPPVGPAVKGKTEIREVFDKNTKDNVVIHSFNATIEDFWISGGRAYERGKWVLAQSSRHSKIPNAYYGSYFQIWRIQPDSSLLIDYLIYTLGFNPFEGRR
jgi:ketosteroid isomerase-like protein